METAAVCAKAEAESLHPTVSSRLGCWPSFCETKYTAAEEREKNKQERVNPVEALGVPEVGKCLIEALVMIPRAAACTGKVNS